MLLLAITPSTTTSRARATTTAAAAAAGRGVVRAAATKGATDGGGRVARSGRVGGAALAAAAQDAGRERERVVRHAGAREHLELVRVDALAALRGRGLRRALGVVVEARDHVARGRALEVLGFFARYLFFAGGLFFCVSGLVIARARVMVCVTGHGMLRPVENSM